MGVQDRYARAVVSSRLQSNDHALVDVDVLTVAGWHRNSLAATLSRARASPNNPASVRAARVALAAYTAARLASRSRRSRIIAARLLAWLLAPFCPACRGRRFDVIQGTQRLSDIACKTCGGSGLRTPTHDRLTPDEARLQNEVAQKLERFERHLATGMK